MTSYPASDPEFGARQYLQMFRMVRVWSQDIRQKTVLDEYLEAGFLWVRPVHRPFAQTLRNPTVGRLLELYVSQQPYCVPIRSRSGYNLIHRLCSVG